MQHLPALARRPSLLFSIIAAAIGIIVLSLWLFGSLAPAEPAVDDLALQEGLEETPGFGLEDSLAPPSATATPAPPNIVVVYVSGAVRKPDVYKLPVEARIKDLVLAAGGLTEDADLDAINLAERLSDAQQIHVPRLGEVLPGMPNQSPSSPAQDQLININTASAAELDSLPGIGQVLAERIVEYRSANGPFASVEDLRNVKGITSAIFDEIAPRITTGP